MKKGLLFIIIINILLLPALTVIAQDWIKMMDEGKSNFYDIQKSFNKYWSEKEKLKEKKKQQQKNAGPANEHEEEGGFMQFKRWEYFWKPRVYPTGQFPNRDIAYKESAKWKNTHTNPKYNQNSIQAISNWSSLGPSVIPSNGGVGRLNCVRFDPTNTNIIYVGAAAGGLWKSTNGGASWTTNTDNLQVIGVSDVLIDPSNTNTMYLATGDGDAGDTYSIGVLKSTDGGTTWNTTGLSWTVNQGVLVRKLIMHPSNSNIILAATNAGIYKTTNAGSSWTQTLAVSTRDIKFNTANPAIVYVGGYGSGVGFYRSTNTGDSFSQITSGLPTTGIYRVAIGVTANDANYVYVLICNNTDYGLKGVYRSVDGGSTFSTMATSPNLLGWNTNGGDAGGQGWYDLCITVNPTNKLEVYTGGVNQWKSTNGGTSWSNISYWAGSGTTYVHADVHAQEFLPGSSTTLFSANDGGLFKSTNNGVAWSDISAGLVISQMYRLSTSATNANLNLAGHQDNGTNRYSSGSWAEVLGGDGMECIIDYTNANIMYSEIYYGEIYKSTNGGSSFGFTPIVGSGGTGVNADGDWVTPYIMHPTTNTTLLVGKAQVYRSTNSGTSWSQVGTVSGGTGNLIALAYGVADPNYIYAAKVNKFYVTSDGGTNWTDRTSGLPTASAPITYIAVDPSNSQRVWVTFSGYSSGNKVFFSSNAGASWTNFSGTLPNIPVNCIVYQKNTTDALYVGTDVGVYYRDGTLSDWTSFFTNLPNVIVDELEIQYSSGKIRAATFGRGMWESPLNSAVPSNAITISSISPTTYCAGSSVSVPYTISGTFNAGNIFTAELSNSTGSFTSPTSIGTLSSTSAGTISSTIPAGTASGAAYRIRVTSNSPSVTGSNNGSNITINAKPTVTANSNSPVCSTNSINLSSTGGTTYFWTGPNSFTSTQQNPIIASATTANSGTYTVIATNSNGCSNSATTSVTVNTKPVATAGNNSPLCAGNNLTLTSSGGTSYSWAGPNIFSSTLQNPSITNVTTAATGTYTVTVTSNGCSSSATTIVTVNAKPVAIAGNNSPLCAGNTLSLTSSGGTSYSWAGPNSFSSTLQNPSIINATTAAAGTYTVTVTSNGCSSSSATIAMVNTTPVAAVGSNSPVCTGKSVNLTSSGGTSYLWTGPNSFISTLQNPSILNSTTAAAGTYSVTVTSSNGCSNSATTSVTINSSPTATAANNSPACAGNSVNLSSAGGTGYSWTGPNSFSSTQQNPTVTGTVSASAGTYTVTVTNASGCSATANTVVTINGLPLATASSNSPVCLGNTINLSSDGGTNYLWSGPDSFTSTQQSPVITNSSTGDAGTYTVTVTGVNGCSASASTVVSINTNCNHITMSLQNCARTASNALEFDLYAVSDGAGTSDLSANSFQYGINFNTGIMPAGATLTPSYIAGTSDFGIPPLNGFTFPTSIFPDHIRILESALAGGNPGTTHMILGQPYRVGRFQLTCSASWIDNTNPNFSLQDVSTGGKTLCASIVWIGTATSSTSFAITGQGNNQRSISMSCSLTLTGCAMTVSTASTDVSCFGGSNGTATASSSGGVEPMNYSWSNGQNTQTISGLSAGTYSVTVTDAVNCFAVASIIVSQPAGAPGVSANNNSPVCTGDTVTFTSVVSGGTAPYSYAWNGPNGFISTIQNPEINSPVSNNAGTYSITVIDSKGCPANATTVVSLNTCSVVLNMNLFIDGYYIGNSYMKPVLLNEIVSGATSAETDTITIELHDAGNPSAIVESQTAILMSDGSVSASFNGSVIGNSYWIAVRHRNAIQTWSASPVFFNATTTYDFTSSQLTAYGNNLAQEDGVWAFFSGDLNQDENIDLLDFPYMDNAITNGLFGYYASDLNGDGNVDLLDFPVLDINISNGVFSSHP